MSEISRSKLFSKLGVTTYKALESATVFCKLRGNPYVELVHWLFQLSQVENGDIAKIVEKFGMDSAKLQADFTRALDALPRGASSISDLSSHIDEAVERAWTYASVMYGSERVRSAHLVIGALKSTSLRNALFSISREFDKVKIDRLMDEFYAVTADSSESTDETGAASSGEPGVASGALSSDAQEGSALKRHWQPARVAPQPTSRWARRATTSRARSIAMALTSRWWTALAASFWARPQRQAHWA